MSDTTFFHLRSSRPGSGRRKLAVLLVLIFAVSGSLIRLSRRDFALLSVLAPFDCYGTSPNFIVCAGMPFIAFLFKDVIGLSSYVKTAVGSAVGLSIYEGLQVYLPRRTFDPYDIVASLLGAIFSLLLAILLFFCAGRRTKESSDKTLAGRRVAGMSLRSGESRNANIS